ncbi:hypothetical protein BUALT_Bualt02G0140200 [Buddleja alternifolia]|uniref:Uncharacterized protein n=1 Tax=Buddleja alternifolia TaxID=168488 RepID=A0AAV6Y044_9LAMI|nr:hypothetical protein BUALT_Bualt02G0140200 [Buddleja alternifolia]
MALHKLLLYALISTFSLFSFTFSPHSKVQNSELKTYIVHVKKPEGMQSDHTESYDKSFLHIPSDIHHQKKLLYSYQNVMSGLSARLTTEELEAIKANDGFVSARLERILHPLTTHSPSFLGLHQEKGFWKQSNFGKGVIIGVLDTGILPSHPSFSDEGMPPPPAKLIGARTFNLAANASKGDEEPPLDDDGHGTHTASTAAGGFVQNASVLGNAYGTAVGMAPKAHLAIYKVCFGPDCPESDILAGLDAAVADSVDVLSLSIGGVSGPFFDDGIAIGSFAAVQKGIFVSCASGNSGPSRETLSNEAPWVLTVGASTIDRSIRAIAKLGDGREFDGESVYQPKNFTQVPMPLVYAGFNGRQGSGFCGNGSLEGVDVTGKVV